MPITISDPEKWAGRFLDLAEHISTWSKDQSTKVGCVLVADRRVIATGYNGAPRGVDEEAPERNERPEKYYWYEHAERNAIFNCAREGVRTEGASAFIFPLFPCAACARALVQSGISKLFVKVDEKGMNRLDDESHDRAKKILEEAGVDVCIYFK